MRWSYSKSRIFEQCQRKWFYMDIMAHHSPKNPERREVYILSQLRSIYAWRGSLVDKVIERKIIPYIINGWRINEDEVLNFARDLAQKQIRFARERRYNSPEVKKSQIGDVYCALFDYEYGNDINNDKIEEAFEEAITSLKNLLDSQLYKMLKNNDGRKLIAQRSLSFSFDGVTITGTPDLIILHEKEAPIIIDWKVRQGYYDSRQQLAIYAFILSNCNSHKDFPSNFTEIAKYPEDYKLYEYQLLNNNLRSYRLVSEDISDIEDYILLSIRRMAFLTDGKKYDDLDIAEFTTTNNPENCSRCNFKRVCWKGEQNGQD